MRQFFLLIITTLLFGNILAQQNKNEELITAILNDNVDSVKLLLTQGANPNYETVYGITPLLFAIEKEDTTIISSLLDYGANIDVVPPYDLPPLSYVILNYKDSLLRYLLIHGADPNLQDQTQRTPLYYAIRSGNYYAADMLLLYGADPNEVVDNWTPLQLAAYYNDTLLINMLLFYGADINKSDTLGLTPLHVAAQYDNLLAAQTLTKNHARLDILSKDLASPVDMAIYTRSNKVFDFLIDSNPCFDNFIDGKYDAFQLAVLEQNYYARRVLAQKNLARLTLHFDYYIRFTQFFNFSDYMVGGDLGLKELYSDVSLSFGFYRRLWDKRIIMQQSENILYQFWEERWVISIMSKKDFYLFHTGGVNHYFSLGVNYLMSYATYRGTLMKDLTVRFEPLVGYSIDYEHFGFELLFTVLPKHLLATNEIYSNVGVYYRLPSTKLKLRTKKKLLY